MFKKIIYSIITILLLQSSIAQKILKPIWTNPFVGRYSEFSPDSKKILTVSNGVTVFSTETKKILATFSDKSGSIVETHFDNTGKYVATASEDTIRIRDSESGSIIRSFGVMGRTIRSFQYDSSGKKIITVGNNDSVCKVWDAETGKLLNELHGHKWTIMSIKAYPSKNWLLTLSLDRKVKVWDIESGNVIQTFPYSGHDIKKAKLSAKSNKIATLTDNYKVQIWDVVSGNILYVFSQPHTVINDIDIDENGEKAVTISKNYDVLIWDLTDGKILKTLKGHNRDITSIVFNKQSDKLLTISDDSTCKLWDVNSGELIKTIRYESGKIAHADFNSTGDVFTISNLVGECSVMDSKTGENLFSLNGESYIYSAYGLPNGEGVFIQNNFGELHRWNVRTGEIKTLVPCNNKPFSMLIDSEGDTFFTAGDSIAAMWTTDTLGLVKKIMKSKVELGFIQKAHHKVLVFITDKYGGASLWNLQTGEMQQEIFETGFTPGPGIRFIVSDNKYMVCNYNSLAHMYKFYDGKYDYFKSFGWGNGSGIDGGFIDNGEKVITINNKSIFVWESSTVTQLTQIGADYSDHKAFCVNKSGDKIFVSYGDGSIRLWNLQSPEKPVYTIQSTPNSIYTKNIVLSNDGTKLFSTNDDKDYRIWDTETGELLAVLSGQGGKVDFMEFVNDDNQLLTCARVGGANLWDVSNLHPSKVSENVENTTQTTSILPNPASDRITIRVHEEIQGTAHYTITDQFGNIVSEGRIPEKTNELRIPTSDLPLGMYIFTTEINGKKVQEKFVVMR